MEESKQDVRRPTGIGVVLHTAETKLRSIPERHQGLSFTRTRSNSVSGKLELAFATQWAHLNAVSRNYPQVLGSMLFPVESDPRRDSAPKTAREWEVAELVAATVIQWLGTSSGSAFMRDSYSLAGGSLKETLPSSSD